jgi:hypothetical protein
VPLFPIEKLGVQGVMFDLLGVLLCSMCRSKEAGVLWISAQPDLCGIMWSRDSPPTTQATTDSVHLQLCRGMDLDGTHPRS